jgi:Thymidylate synthase complementing protein
MFRTIRNMTRVGRAVRPTLRHKLRQYATNYDAGLTVASGSGISARILADSVTRRGDRITSYELEYPRFIHSEFMTHRAFSKNAASSRAIPVSKMIENIRTSTAMPVHWGQNKRGMQAEAENDNMIRLPVGLPVGLPNESNEEVTREEAWESARDSAIEYAQAFSDAGYHKQVTNRMLEPYKMMKVVCSATEYDNFFWLRCHPDAQPEIRELADVMYEARDLNEPKELFEDEYHLPYVTNGVRDMCYSYRTYADTTELMLKVSASCCAQVSYRTMDVSLEKALKIYDMLVKSEPMHASPFEHQARPMDDDDIQCFKDQDPDSPITHVDRRGDYWSGNFRGWIQHRHEIPNNTYRQ